jgi:hypothetical protein
MSPFNITDRIDNSYFTIKETRKLFQEFAQDARIVIDDAVIEDIWVNSGGYATSSYYSINTHIWV